MFKLFVTLTVLCVFGTVLVRGFDKKEALAKLMVNMEDCKTTVAAKDVDKLELLGKKPASTMEGKCLRSCLMEIYKVMNSNGKFDKEIALSHAEKITNGDAAKMKVSTEIINNCSDIAVSHDHCEAAEQYGKCLMEQVTAHGVKEENL